MAILHDMADAAKAVKEYAGSELSRHMDIMLTNLAESYRLELQDVSEKDLLALQTKLKQTLAIRAVIRADQDLPRV